MRLLANITLWSYIMNVFYLDHDPIQAATYHCDSHTIKMILEYGQLLSTAHRVLDGRQTKVKNAAGRNRTVYIFDDKVKEKTFYKSCYEKHPSNIWLRESKANYMWLYNCFIELGKEFVKRYNKTQEHMTIQKLAEICKTPPINIPDKEFTGPTPAMPDYCKVEGDSLASYRKYYIEEKHFAKWKFTDTPEWYVLGKKEQMNSDLSYYEALV